MRARGEKKGGERDAVKRKKIKKRKREGGRKRDKGKIEKLIRR